MGRTPLGTDYRNSVCFRHVTAVAELGLMKKAIILHGTGGSPEGNWFRWLESELKMRGIDIWLPQLPNAEKPRLKIWLKFVNEHSPFVIDKDTIIFGHSSGATLALLLSIYTQVGRVVAVAPFIPMPFAYSATDWEANEKLFNEININEMLTSRQPDNIQRVVISSTDDPYIPEEVAQYICDKTKITRLMMSGQGHFNLEKSTDFKQFPLLLQFINEDWPVKNLPEQVKYREKKI